MALIKCTECGREISDKAKFCPGCGSSVSWKEEPKIVEYDSESNVFYGSMNLLVKLAMSAIQENGWTLEQANDSIGLVTFKTSISWGSWSGVSCSLNISEVSPNTFRIVGTGKQNVNGKQLVAINIGNEAQSKANKAIETMKRLVINNEVSNSQEFQTLEQQVQQAKIVSNQIHSTNSVQTPQPISEIKTDHIQNQLFQPLESSQHQKTTFNSGQSFQKNKKILFIILGVFLCLLFLFVTNTYLISLDFEKSKNNIKSYKSAQPTYQESNSTNTQSLSSRKYKLASKRILTSSDFVNLNKYELKIMRNEIYARYGYIFKTEDMKAYFESQPWYTPKYNDVTFFLTEIEKRNIELIKQYE